MARTDCVTKGCRTVICCVVNGVERPIGLLTSATLNSTENTDAAGSYMGGNEVEEQDDAGFVPDTDQMFIGEDERWYSLCSASQSACTHEMTINGDYCYFRPDPDGPIADDAAQKFICQSSVTLRIKRHDRTTGRMDTIFNGEGRTTTKNRNLPGGQDDNQNWSATIEVDPATVEFLNGFH